MSPSRFVSLLAVTNCFLLTHFTLVHLSSFSSLFSLRLNGLDLYGSSLSDLMQFYDGRNGTWQYWHGPKTHNALPDDVGTIEELPPVDHVDNGHDQWTIGVKERG